MTKQQEQELNKEFLRHLQRSKIDGMKQGASGILGAVLEMCNEGKKVKDIQKFCETMLNVQEGV